jgi:hypothetical protein
VTSGGAGGTVGSRAAGAFGENALDGIRVIGSDRRAHEMSDIDHKGHILLGTLCIEVPPVKEVA